GTSQRQGAKKIYQLEILPKPPDTRPADTPWPMWPRIMRTSSSHQEGCERVWSAMTKKLSGGAGIRANQLHACQVEWINKDGNWKVKELPGTEFSLKVDLILLAMGFVHVVHEGLVKDLGIKLDEQGNVTVNDFQTSNPQVFAAGDTINGASLIVTAIDSGRKAAESIDRWLKQQ
ncbi:MAG: FAD-dependent oxidoreductase, partial [Planctomycetota bacterium]